MQANIANRTIFTNDNLPVMRRMDTESVDLIYLDPPFNSKKQWDAPIGSTAEGASFKDTWTYDDIKAEWWRAIEDKSPALYSVINAAGMVGGKADKAYLCYMAIRLLEMHRILKKTGSIYLHCDPTMSHFLKLTMDAILGRENYRNEIIWYYANASRGKYKLAQSHDVIFYYGKGEKNIFNREEILVPFASGMTEWRYTKGGQQGKRMPKGKTPDDVIIMPSLNAMAKERTGYPTQKPLALLTRIIAASSNKDDVVFDPFCGCGTACEAAEKLSRQWIGIDASELAGKIIKERLPLLKKGITIRTDLPERTSTDHTQYKLGLPQTAKEIKQHLYGKQGGVCAGCNVLFPIRNMTQDHIIPRNQGGQNLLENLQLLCGACNSVKGGNLTTEELRAKLRERGII